MQRGGHWSAGTREVRDPGEGDSLQMIPAWAVVLAVAIFVGSMYLFNYTPARPANSQPANNTSTAQTPAPSQASAPATAGQAAPAAGQSGQTAPAPAAAPRPASQSRRPPRPAAEAGHLIFSYTTSAALASYVLLIGYVSRDVKRRHMSAPLWVLIVLVMPGGIGAIVYFMLRQPLMTRCPHCTTELTEGVHFCPQCRFQVAPVCGQCFRGVQITDAYCPQCGHDVAEDAAPARLRAYSDT